MDYSKSEWYKRTKEIQTAEFGAVIPPWIFSQNSHPDGIEWRMGGGESQIMVFGIWWNEKKFSEKEAIDYFKRFTPPPRWLMWMADVIWGVDVWEPEEFVNSSFYDKLTELNFIGIQSFLSDYNDPRWAITG